jgi:hypothetical protein
MKERAFDRMPDPASQNRELVVFDPHLEVFFTHAGHFDFERVAIGVFQNSGRRRDKLFGRLALTIAAAIFAN